MTYGRRTHVQFSKSTENVARSFQLFLFDYHRNDVVLFIIISSFDQPTNDIVNGIATTPAGDIM